MWRATAPAFEAAAGTRWYARTSGSAASVGRAPAHDAVVDEAQLLVAVLAPAARRPRRRRRGRGTGARPRDRGATARGTPGGPRSGRAAARARPTPRSARGSSGRPRRAPGRRSATPAPRRRRAPSRPRRCRPLAEQPRVLDDLRLPAAGEDHDLDARRGGTPRARARREAERRRRRRAAATRRGRAGCRRGRRRAQRSRRVARRAAPERPRAAARTIDSMAVARARPSPGRRCSSAAAPTSGSCTRSGRPAAPGTAVPIPGELHHELRGGAGARGDRRAAHATRRRRCTRRWPAR